MGTQVGAAVCAGPKTQVAESAIPRPSRSTRLLHKVPDKLYNVHKPRSHQGMES